MINLSWNTQGRVALKDYRKERWRHFFFCLIPIALLIVGTIIAGAVQPIVGIGIDVVAVILLFYYRYRFLQVMVKRLHDLDMSGKILILSPIIMLLVIGAVAAFAIYSLSSASLGPVVDNWLADGSGVTSWVVIIPVVAFNGYLRYKMNREGTFGANRYGAPPGTGQANVF